MKREAAEMDALRELTERNQCQSVIPLIVILILPSVSCMRVQSSFV